MDTGEAEMKAAELSAIVFDIKKNTFEAIFSNAGDTVFSIDVNYHETGYNEWIPFIEIYEPDGFALANAPVFLLRRKWEIESISSRFMRMFRKGAKIYDGRT